jgi:hypothetical protein
MPVLSPAVRGEPRALVQLDVEHIPDVPPKLAARVRLLDTGQINNNDDNDARSVALAALRARVVPELVAEDQTMMMRAWAHPMIVDRRPGVYSIPAPGRSLPDGSTRERPVIARRVSLSRATFPCRATTRQRGRAITRQRAPGG